MMDTTLLRSALLCVCLVVATVLGAVLKPQTAVVARLSAVDLPQLVPASFAGWKTEDVPFAGFTADVQAEIDKIYAQVLDRTYVDAGGRRVMLSIAYGRDQETDSQVHRPEFCYEAQGFEISDARNGTMVTGHGEVPVRRMIATRGPRIEPVTYWIVVGDRATLPGVGRKLAQLSYGLLGLVPDGMLVRVSSIDVDSSADDAFHLHERFVRDLVNALSANGRARLTGGPGA
jgi:EpsI family protein